MLGCFAFAVRRLRQHALGDEVDVRTILGIPRRLPSVKALHHFRGRVGDRRVAGRDADHPFPGGRVEVVLIHVHAGVAAQQRLRSGEEDLRTIFGGSREVGVREHPGFGVARGAVFLGGLGDRDRVRIREPVVDPREQLLDRRSGPGAKSRLRSRREKYRVAVARDRVVRGSGRV